MGRSPQDYWQEARAHGLPAEGSLLLVDLENQRVRLLAAGRPVRDYPVSTSARGPGQADGSHCTPTGWHEVRERIGTGEPPGRVFESRLPTETVLPEAAWAQATGKDLILTRILRLGGLEDGVNQGAGIDTYDRSIYLHGTNHEDRLGTPCSHGCIRMGNLDVIDLFDAVAETSCWCWIG